MEKHNINQLLTRLLLGKASEEERAELEKRANREDIQEILDACISADQAAKLLKMNQ